MNYKVGDFVEMDTCGDINTIGKVVGIAEGDCPYFIKFRHGYISRFKETEIRRVVSYKGMMK